FRALIGKTKHSIQHYVEQGFSSLPRGSFIQLEKQSRDYILKNLKQATNNRRNLIHKMKHFEADTHMPLTLENFLNYYGMSLYEFYGGRTGNRSFQGMLVEAGLKEPYEFQNGDQLIKRI